MDLIKRGYHGWINKQQLVGWDFYDETKYNYLLWQIIEKNYFYFLCVILNY